MKINAGGNTATARGRYARSQASIIFSRHRITIFSNRVTINQEKQHIIGFINGLYIQWWGHREDGSAIVLNVEV